jgi:hypothetical protein
METAAWFSLLSRISYAKCINRPYWPRFCLFTFSKTVSSATPKQDSIVPEDAEIEPRTSFCDFENDSQTL